MQSTNDEAQGGPYAVYRAFTTFGETNIQSMFDYYLERIEIEEQYSSNLKRLAKKAFPSIDDKNIVRTSSEAWNRVHQSTLSLATNHQKLVYSIDWILDVLKRSLERQRIKLTDIRADVKLLIREDHEFRTVSIPKLKMNYFKKFEALEAETKISGVSSVKAQKLAKEFQMAENAYRNGIIKQEEMRINLKNAREKAFTMGEEAEKDRIESIRATLIRYGEIEKQVSASRTAETNALALFVDCIKSEVDLNTYLNEFSIAWPEPQKNFYENVILNKPVTNLLYGVPLERLMEQHIGLPAPSNIIACVQFIEEKGLETEGIYRVPGLVSEVESLKLKLESDENSIDWNELNVHTASSVVKIFLRELPNPLFMFPAKDRLEYSAYVEPKERISQLRSRIKNLTKPAQELLKFFTSHLSKVLEKQNMNKSTLQNIALTFAPIFFSMRPDAVQESSGSGWFSKAPAAPQISTDIQMIEILKSDLTMSDLITFKDQIFSNSDDKIEDKIKTKDADDLLRISQELLDKVAETPIAISPFQIGPPALPVRTISKQASYIGENMVNGFAEIKPDETM